MFEEKSSWFKEFYLVISMELADYSLESDIRLSLEGKKRREVIESWGDFVFRVRQLSDALAFFWEEIGEESQFLAKIGPSNILFKNGDYKLSNLVSASVMSFFYFI